MQLKVEALRIQRSLIRCSPFAIPWAAACCVAAFIETKRVGATDANSDEYTQTKDFRPST